MLFQVFPPFLLVLRNDFPTHTSHTGLQAQPADDLFEQQVLPARARENGVHFHLSRRLDVFALQRLQEQGLPAQGMKQESTHVAFLICPANDPE
jgi:hypothetical protein